MSEERARMAAEVAALKIEVERVRMANGALADAFREDPDDAKKGDLKRGASDLATARDRLDTLEIALAIFDKTGSQYGLVADAGRVAGVVAVLVPPGTSREAREKAVDAAIAPELERACDELGVVLAASPVHFARERPGRDADGKTVLEIAGRVEGDRLIPAVSRASKKLRG